MCLSLLVPRQLALTASRLNHLRLLSSGSSFSPVIRRGDTIGSSFCPDSRIRRFSLPTVRAILGRETRGEQEAAPRICFLRSCFTDYPPRFSPRVVDQRYRKNRTFSKSRVSLSNRVHSNMCHWTRSDDGPLNNRFRGGRSKENAETRGSANYPEAYRATRERFHRKEERGERRR